ncbi:hypothetical protein [Kribbella sp. DT2]|uniref:hypothetical protein n=1 Tax=Kribbella sp. DT2 TaxID=3393427 RepID=UPI003CEDDC97
MAERFDLDAIEADDALLDLLAAGGESAWEAGEHDPTLKLLAELRLAVEVEDELPVETIDDPESFLARCAALNPVTDPFTRKIAARGLAVGVAAVAALSVSGVAAAVNGDPLAPYEKIVEKVVEQLRPQTSFPQEKLDGSPLLDKSQIVKVTKDYQQKIKDQREVDERRADQRLSDPLALGLTELETVMPKPPYAPPKVDIKAGTRDPLLPPVQPVDDKPVDKPTAPVDEPIDEPTDKPSDPPTTPIDEPTEPPPPTPTDPPTTPTDPPPTEPTDNGGNGQTGETPGTDPTTAPSEGSGEAGTPGGETGAGDGETTAPGSVETKPAEQPTEGAGDQTGGAGDSKPSDPPADDSKPAGDSKPADDTKPSLPSETPVEPTRLEQYVNQRLQAAAKHSNGEYSLGWAKQQYAKGKHSNGQYAEGKHAAFERAHGSMNPVTLRQILWVLNHPTGR